MPGDENRRRGLRHRPGTPGRQSGRGRSAVAERASDGDLLASVNNAWIEQDRRQAEAEAERERRRTAEEAERRLREAEAERERRRQAEEAERQRRAAEDAERQRRAEAENQRRFDAEDAERERKRQDALRRKEAEDEKRRKRAARRQHDTAIIDGWVIDVAYLVLVRLGAAGLLAITFGGTILAFHGGVNGLLRQFPLPEALGAVGQWIGAILVHPSTLLAILSQVIITVIQFRHRLKHRTPVWWTTVVVSVTLTFFGGLDLVPGWIARVLAFVPWPPEETHQAASLLLFLVICFIADTAAERYLVRDKG